MKPATVQKTRVHYIDCIECKRKSVCRCSVYHSICGICTMIQKLKDSGVKPIKADIRDRGTYVWGNPSRHDVDLSKLNIRLNKGGG